MQFLVLERVGEMTLRDMPMERDEVMGPHDLRIALHTVGICGSDVHYLTHGRIGPFLLQAPMILGHEASGIVTEVGRDAQGFAVGDRVCMEPGIPDPLSLPSRLGMYNIDPAVRFRATPPHHGILRPSCVHPAAFTFKLPDNVSFAEGAMLEPLAVGNHAATRARIKPGDIGLIMGAGPIGLLTALSALAAGCARVDVSDIDPAKLDLAGRLGAITPLNAASEPPAARILRDTDGWGVDVVFEATGSARAAATVFDALCPGGCVVMIGGQAEPVAFDAGAAMVREARVESIFRYAHVFPRCVNMIASGAINVKPLITRSFGFADSIQAFHTAASAPKGEVKMQIVMPGF